MSKYKYSSLLSSQYRQVFKSYHSLDRCQKELEVNLAKSLRKRVNTQIDQIEKRNASFHNDKTQYNYLNNQSSQSYLYYKTQPKYVASTGVLVNRMDQDKNSSKFRSGQNFTRINHNEYKSFIAQHKAHPISSQPSYFLQQRAASSVQYKNHELKMKVSEINKRRNDIKLKVRVNDIDKINKRYDYLKDQNKAKYQLERNITYKQKVFLSRQNLCQQKGKFPQSNEGRKEQPQKVHEFDQKNLQGNSIERFPLMEPNRNPTLAMNNKKNKETSNNLSRNSLPKSNDQQNIQTPHFHHAQTKKTTVSPCLISMKLQNLVKNTFTDRF